MLGGGDDFGQILDPETAVFFACFLRLFLKRFFAIKDYFGFSCA